MTLITILFVKCCIVCSVHPDHIDHTSCVRHISTANMYVYTVAVAADQMLLYNTIGRFSYHVQTQGIISSVTALLFWRSCSWHYIYIPCQPVTSQWVNDMHISQCTMMVRVLLSLTANHIYLLFLITTLLFSIPDYAIPHVNCIFIGIFHAFFRFYMICSE